MSGGTNHKFCPGLKLLKSASGFSFRPKLREREENTRRARLDGHARRVSLVYFARSLIENFETARCLAVLFSDIKSYIKVNCFRS